MIDPGFFRGANSTIGYYGSRRLAAASPQEPLTADAWRWGRSDFAFAPVVLLSAAAGSQVGRGAMRWTGAGGVHQFISKLGNTPQFMVILW